MRDFALPAHCTQETERHLERIGSKSDRARTRLFLQLPFVKDKRYLNLNSVSFSVKFSDWLLGLRSCDRDRDAFYSNELS